MCWCWHFWKAVKRLRPQLDIVLLHYTHVLHYYKRLYMPPRQGHVSSDRVLDQSAIVFSSCGCNMRPHQSYDHHVVPYSCGRFLLQ